MPSRPYAELRAASAFSFLDGATLPEHLVAHAAQKGLPAMPLVDTNGVHGAPRFYTAAKKTGVKPLVGSELVMEDEKRQPRLVFHHQLAADERFDSRLFRGRVEAGGAMDAVGIDEGHGWEPFLGGVGHEMLGERGAVEEREGGGSAELGVWARGHETKFELRIANSELRSGGRVCVRFRFDDDRGEDGDELIRFRDERLDSCCFPQFARSDQAKPVV